MWCSALLPHSSLHWKASCLSAHKPQPLLSATRRLLHGSVSIPSARPLCLPSYGVWPPNVWVSHTLNTSTWPCSPWGPKMPLPMMRMLPSWFHLALQSSQMKAHHLQRDALLAQTRSPNPRPRPRPTRTCFYSKVSPVSTAAGNNTAAEEWVPGAAKEPRHRLQCHTAGGEPGLHKAPPPHAHVLPYLKPRALSVSLAANSWPYAVSVQNVTSGFWDGPSRAGSFTCGVSQVMSFSAWSSMDRLEQAYLLPRARQTYGHPCSKHRIPLSSVHLPLRKLKEMRQEMVSILLKLIQAGKATRVK